MKKLGKLLQWIGFIFIALFPFFALDESYTNYLPILLISGVTLGLFGSLLDRTSKIGILALCLALSAVITYFYVEQSLFYKVLIISSLFLVVVVLVNQVFLRQKQKSQKMSKRETQ